MLLLIIFRSKGRIDGKHTQTMERLASTTDQTDAPTRENVRSNFLDLAMPTSTLRRIAEDIVTLRPSVQCSMNSQGGPTYKIPRKKMIMTAIF